MNTDFILKAAHAVNDAILRDEAEIESLDREIGDGDHFINMKRGCRTVVDMEEELTALTPDAALQKIGMKLLSTIGGASGPLVASLFLAMAKHLAAYGNTDLKSTAAAFAAGVAAIKQRGKADIGEKTMLDVLIPVSEAFCQLADQDADHTLIFQRLKETAERGMLATRDLVATKGRAAFLGERAIGHIDPGAKSSQVIIRTLCDLALSHSHPEGQSA